LDKQPTNHNQPSGERTVSHKLQEKAKIMSPECMPKCSPVLDERRAYHNY